MTVMTVGVLYMVFRKSDFSELWSEIIKANFGWVVLSLAFATTGFIIRALRWKLLIEGSGFTSSFSNTFWSVIVAYFANIPAPRLGEVVRCAVLKKKERIPFDVLFGTVIIERIIDLVCLLLLLSFTIVIKISFFGNFFISAARSNFEIFSRIRPLYFILFSITSLLILFLIVVFVKSKFPAFFNRILAFIKGIFQGIIAIRTIKSIPLFIFYTVFIWISYLMMTWVVFFALDATSHLTVIDAIFILVAGGIGMSVPVQNGFGAFHGIVASALALYGIDFNTHGLVYAILCHESQTILVVILGFISLIVLSKKLNYE